MCPVNIPYLTPSPESPEPWVQSLPSLCVRLVWLHPQPSHSRLLLKPRFSHVQESKGKMQVFALSNSTYLNVCDFEGVELTSVNLGLVFLLTCQPISKILIGLGLTVLRREDRLLVSAERKLKGNVCCLKKKRQFNEVRRSVTDGLVF